MTTRRGAASSGNRCLAYTDPFGLCPPEDTDFGPLCPGFWSTALAGAGAIIGGVGGGAGGFSAGAAACSPAGPAAIVCAGAGAAAGSAAGASRGARIGLFVGSAVDLGVQAAVQMASAGKGRGGNTGPNAQVDRIVKESGLNRAGRRALHDAISKAGEDLDEIRAIAENLAKQAKYLSNPPPAP